MRSIHVAAERVSRIAARVTGYALLLTALFVSLDVVLRKTISFSFNGADEISGYVLIVLTAWGFSHALFARSHIRIDLLHARVPRSARAMLDIVALLALGVLAGLLAYYGSGLLAESWRIGTTANTPLRTPLWIPQTLWVAGLLFFCFAIAVVLLRSILALLQGRPDIVERIAGVATVREETEEELAALPRRATQGAADSAASRRQ